MKLQYEIPFIVVSTLTADDVITTSGITKPDYSGEWDEF